MFCTQQKGLCRWGTGFERGVSCFENQGVGGLSRCGKGEEMDAPEAGRENQLHQCPGFSAGKLIPDASELLREYVGFVLVLF